MGAHCSRRERREGGTECSPKDHSPIASLPLRLIGRVGVASHPPVEVGVLGASLTHTLPRPARRSEE